MPLQTDNLVMVGLGVKDDSPPNTYQPPLDDGIHLRWSFEQALGFPWYGYYLFRRPSQKGNPICLSAATDGFQKGNWNDKVLNTLNGQLSSDANLVLTDDFSPSGRVEFDLAVRAYLRFELPSGEPAYRVDVQIGFRQSAAVPSSAKKQVTCVNFTEFPRSTGPNPRIEKQVQFTVRAQPGGSQPQTQIDLRGLSSGETTGLNCGFQLEITLPVPCLFVELTLSHNSAPPRFEAFNADGSSAGSIQLQTPKNQLETARIRGTAITRVVVFTPKFEVWLHNFCFGSKAGPASEIQIKALFEDTQVAGTTVTGQPGQVVSASLEFDAITAIQVSPGAAALVDVCFVPVSQGATRGWKPAPGFPSPMCLPVTDPDYPCSGGAPVNLAAAETLALSRVHYGSAAIWGGANFASLHDTLLELVAGGPSSLPMAARSKSVGAAPSPTDGVAGPPTMPSQHPLDLVLLSALHPPFAQMVGLYWNDSSAGPNQPFDYLIVADYTGIGGRNPGQILSIIASSGFDKLDGYIVFNKRVAPADPLRAPGDPRAYALPGGTFPRDDGSLPDGQNNAGLRWDLGVTDVELLLPDKPIMYHIWRADLGNKKKPAKGVTHNLITQDRPVLVTEPRVPPGAVVQRAADWPAFPLQFIDTYLPDRWYSYEVSGVDIFGRHSANSDAADWYQWQPMPNPRPWYYQDPPGDSAIRVDAVRLLDKIPPPPPTGIEAHALDPADPTVVKDGLYQTWRGSLKKKEGKRLIGLRVKWLWPLTHQRQAPDTLEFRIYFHPGSPLPAPDHSQAINWQERYYVVAYDDPAALRDVDVDGQGTRLYEIILPAAGDAFRKGLPLSPSLAEPVVYAHIGVSSADNKPHTADAPKWEAGRWGGGDRFGNEGRVGAQVTIYRVLRTPPDPPAVPPDAKKVFATKADYHSRSFYTYRWNPLEQLKTHIFRAMDDTVFKTDWSSQPRPALTASQLDLFPDETIDPRWNAIKRQQVVDELNQLNTFAQDDTGTAAALTDYRGLSNDGLRILAGLPGNERAFSQLTINPLHPDDTDNKNRRGPDNDDSFVVDPALRAYVDTLDGRATNRYFYRAAYVDGAHNRSQFSLSGPPVYLPKVVPPRAPVITKVLAGELQVTLRWASNREADLAAYRVYRTDDEGKARDVRLMEVAATISQAAINVSDPGIEWIDNADLIGGHKYFYRMTAADTFGNASEPTRVYMGIPVDTRVPPPPIWTERKWLLRRQSDDTFISWPADGIVPAGYEPVLRLGWRSETPEPQFVVTRLIPGGQVWTALTNATQRPSPTTQDEFVLLDFEPDPESDILYRLKVRSSSGVWSTEESILSVTPPEAA